MIDSFLTVSQQVLMLFLLIGVGFLLGKLKLLNAQGSLCMSNLMLYAVIPCLVVSSFQRPLEAEHLQNFALTVLLSLAVHIAMIAVSAVTLRRADPEGRSIYSLCAVIDLCWSSGLRVLCPDRYPPATACLCEIWRTAGADTGGTAV